MSAGHSTAVLRAASYGSPMAAFQDAMAGIAYYQFIEKLDKEFEERKDEIIENLKSLMTEILRPENLSVSYTGERESLETMQKQVRELKKTLHQEAVETSPAPMICEKKNEGFMTSGQVQYAAQAGNFRKKGFAYTGALNILKVALSYDYLWINIRVKGGAYGCMSGFKYSGESFFVSYRDPHLKRTYDVFAGIPDYVRGFKADEREMTKYIIGTISDMDTPMNPSAKGARSMTAYLQGLDFADIQKERDQVIGATDEDIRGLKDLIASVLEEKNLCVIGNEDNLKSQSDMFMQLKNLCE